MPAQVPERTGQACSSRVGLPGSRLHLSEYGAGPCSFARRRQRQALPRIIECPRYVTLCEPRVRTDLQGVTPCGVERKRLVEPRERFGIAALAVRKVPHVRDRLDIGWIDKCSVLQLPLSLRKAPYPAEHCPVPLVGGVVASAKVDRTPRGLNALLQILGATREEQHEGAA